MKKLLPRYDNIFGVMVDGYGETITPGGILIIENNMDTLSIRPRWFRVTHRGPTQTDIEIGEFVLMTHGRWSRKITIDFGLDDDIFHLDPKEVLLVTPNNPLKFG